MSSEFDSRGCARIVIHEPVEWRHWSHRFGVRPKELKRAIRQVGNSREALERYFDIQGRSFSAEHKARLIEMLYGAVP